METLFFLFLILLFLALPLSPFIMWRVLYLRKKKTESLEKFQSYLIYRQTYFADKSDPKLKTLRHVLGLHKKEVARVIQPEWLLQFALERLKERGDFSWSNLNQKIVDQLFALGLTEAVIEKELSLESKERIEAIINDFLWPPERRARERNEASEQVRLRSGLFEFYLESRADRMLKKQMKVSWL